MTYGLTIASPLPNTHVFGRKDLSTKAKRRKLVHNLMEGETRVMHAKLLRSQEFDASMELGRYKVIDLEVLAQTGSTGRAIRMVDTRSVCGLRPHT